MVQMPENRPFKLSQDMLTEIDEQMGKIVNAPSPIQSGYSMNIVALGEAERILLTFIDLDGYPILRVTINGTATDLILNSDQVKLLLRQMTLWLTK